MVHSAVCEKMEVVFFGWSSKLVDWEMISEWRGSERSILDVKDLHCLTTELQF